MKLHPTILLLLFSSLLALAGPAAAQKAKQVADFEGRVVRVVDGATLVVRLADKSEQTVRLRHIDAPEACQAGGAEATQSLVDVALGQNVQVSGVSRPGPGPGLRPGLVLAGVALDGVDLSRRQVEEGQAWSLRFRYDNGPLVKEERMARALRRGFHAAGAAEMPKDFRRRNGPCAAGASASPAGAPPPAVTGLSAPVVSAYRCDGRTRCTQMRSCEEASYFLKNCPSTAMDGDNDGVPCEDQWCR